MPPDPPSTVNVILFLAADPSDLARLRIGEESREIQEKLRLARLRDQFDVEVRLSVRPADVSQSLLDLAPRFVHFSGHGAQNGAICFETRTGESLPIAPEALSALFSQFAGTVECVVLNACFSAVQAEAIAAEIPYVIGMRSEVGNRAAIAFSVGFYQAIGAGRAVEDAFRLGVVQIQLEGLPEALTPVLVRKGERVPDIRPAPAPPVPERPRSLPGREGTAGAGRRRELCRLPGRRYPQLFHTGRIGRGRRQPVPGSGQRQIFAGRLPAVGCRQATTSRAGLATGRGTIWRELHQNLGKCRGRRRAQGCCAGDTGDSD